MKGPLILFLSALFWIGCSLVTISCIPKFSQEAVKPDAQSLALSPDVPAEKFLFYLQEFPEAFRFEKKLIPEEVLPPTEKGNHTYFVAYDKNDTIIGYLRDFSGPVTTAENCACSPLSLTLAFSPNYQLQNILSVAPLQKIGHEELTPEEHKKMVSIAQKPAPELLRLSYAQDMIDGATGATSAAYSDKVVATAGYSSWRIAHLTTNTSRLLQGMPMYRDQKRLEDVLTGVEDPLVMQSKLMSFIPTAESNHLKRRALMLLADVYAKNGQQSAAVEKVLLASGLQPRTEAESLLSICFAYSTAQQFPHFIPKCLQRLQQNEYASQIQNEIDLLQGVTAYNSKDYQQAATLLGKSLSKWGSNAPANISKQYIDALIQIKQTDKACSQAKQLYTQHPLLVKKEDFLSTCKEKNLIRTLDKKRRTALLATKVEKPVIVSPMPVTTDDGKNIQLHMAEQKKVTVLVFFATWCPHCQQEMPHLVAFSKLLKSNKRLSRNVQLIAVRCSVPREVEPYEEFKKRYQINFPIFTDNSIAFENFAVEQNRRAAYPTVAVVDRKGKAQYFLSTGPHDDAVQQLRWLVDSLTK